MNIPETRCPIWKPKRTKPPTVDEVRKLLEESWAKWCADEGSPPRRSLGTPTQGFG